MKRICLLACCLTLIAAASVKPASSAGPRSGGMNKATCIANCAGGTTVSCTSSGSCTAVNRACPTNRGHVTCGGVTTSCPACAPNECTGTGIREIGTGECCAPVGTIIRRVHRQEKCVNGVWTYVKDVCKGPCEF